MRPRRGAAAVELALVAVLIVLLAAAGTELPWALFQQARLRSEVRVAARAAAAVPIDDDPAATFLASFPGDTATATVSGTPPSRALDVTVSRAPRALLGAGLFGVFGLDALQARHTVRLEDQRPEAP